MAVNILDTRIQLKNDTLNNWLASEIIPLEGEICIVTIPQGTENSGLTAPAIGIKVGDGEKLFSALPWIKSIAGDVQNWAKAANKPIYIASEISAEVIANDGETVASRLNTNDTHLTSIYNQLSSADNKFTTINQKFATIDNKFDSVDSNIESINSDIEDLAAQLENAEFPTVEVYRIYTNQNTNPNQWMLQKKVVGADDSTYTTVSTIDLTDTIENIPNLFSFDETYDATTNKIATQTGVQQAITVLAQSLNGIIRGTPATSRTITSLEQVNGKVSATFSDISITISQIANAGTAIEKNVVNTITSDNKTSTDLVTVAALTDYINTQVSALTGAMHFRGLISRLPTNNRNFEAGDVLFLIGSNKEYIFDGSEWREFGDEGSFALKTIEISGSDGLTGGGTLDSNRTITHGIPLGAYAGSRGGDANSSQFLQNVVTDKFGHVIGVTIGTISNTGNSDDTIYNFYEGSINGNFLVTDSNGNSQPVPIHGLAAAAYKSLASAINANDTGLVTGQQVYNYLLNFQPSSGDEQISQLNSQISASTPVNNQYSVLTGITETAGKLTGYTEVQLATVARTGNLNDLIQNQNDVIVFNCGSSTENI